MRRDTKKRDGLRYPASMTVRFVLISAIVWTVLITCSLAWNWIHIGEMAVLLAEQEARSSFQKDLVYRRWAAMHGGVYAPPTERTPPNPYLSHIPDRDVTTTTGKELTLVNPAYMTRQVHELASEEYGVRGHITSLDPIRPENAADPWETQALQSFVSGRYEVSAIGEIDGTPYLRLMRPLVTEESCLNCHAAQGYEVGDIRGGISVSVPMTPYTAAARHTQTTLASIHALIALSGLIGLYTATRMLRRSEGALHESEERERLALSATSDGVWDWNVATGSIDYSPAWKSMLSHKRADNTYDTWISRIHPDDKQAVLEGLQVCLDGKTERWSQEHRLRTADGTWKWVLGRGRVEARDVEGKPLRMVGMMTDISRLKHAEEDRARLTTILENTTDFVSTARPDARLMYLNAAGRRMAGWGPDENVHKHRIPDFHPAWALQIIEQEGLPTAVRDGFWQGETAILDSDGHEIPVSQVILSHKSDDESVLFFSTIIRDMTEQKRIEKELLESEKRFRAVFEQAGDYILVLGLDEEQDLFVADANEAACQIHGYTRDEFIGTRIRDIDRRLDKDEVQALLDRTMAGESVLFETEHAKRDGTTFPIEVSARLLDVEGDSPLIISIERDISDRKRAEMALQESEEIFGSLFRASPMGIYIYELEDGDRLVLKAANTAADHLTGVDNAERIGKTIEEAFPPLAETEIPYRYHKAAGCGESWFTEQIDYEHGGISGAFEVYVFQLSPGKAAVLFNNIIERKRAEEAVRTSQAQLSTALRMAHAGHWEYDIASDTFTFNDNFYRIFHTTAEEVGGYTMLSAEYARKFCHPDDMHLVQEEIQAALETVDPDYSRQLEHRITYTNGDIGYIVVRFFIKKNSKGRTVMVYGVNQDITERKRAEAELRDSEARFRTLVENAPEAIVVLDFEEGAFVDFNENACKLYQLTPEEMLTKGPIALSPPFQPDGKSSEESALEKLHQAIAGESVRFEWIHRNARGVDIPCEINLTQLPSSDRTLIRGSMIDITDRKRAEEERARLQEQLAQAQKMESVGRLAGGVAHDFNNMLGVILGHTEMALEQVEFERELHGDLEEIRRAAVRSADLTRQLLAFARRQTVAPKVLHLNAIIEGTLKMLRRLIGEDIDLSWHPGADLWTIRMDPSQIDQILANLAVNARDAIAGVGKVTIETKNIVLDAAYCAEHTQFEPGEYVRVDVSDDGCGMDQETLDHVFEPFYTTKGMGEGTGLGLATVYGIVTQNNGFINVYSEPEEGTTFAVYLPRHKAEKSSLPEEGPTHLEVPGQETILLVEDQPALLKMISTMLEKLGYTVLSASTPGEAISLARENPGDIHILMTDVVMPEMNGRDLAKNILSIYPQVKRLFMSGYTANVIAHHGVLDEGVHFIQKPFSREDLSVKVREALEDES